jgi:hypothetical protein
MARKRLDVPTQRFNAAELAKAARQMDEHVRDLPTMPPPGPSGHPSSEVRLATVRDDDDPWLEKVPVVVASAEDLAWFGLEVGAQAVLSLIDGTASVRAILTRAPLARAEALAFLRELEAHQVVAID